jgi:hypothetical protein
MFSLLQNQFSRLGQAATGAKSITSDTFRSVWLAGCKERREERQPFARRRRQPYVARDWEVVHVFLFFSFSFLGYRYRVLQEKTNKDKNRPVKRKSGGGEGA